MKTSSLLTKTDYLQQNMNQSKKHLSTKTFFMKRVLLFILLIVISNASMSQSILDKINKSLNKINNSYDSLNKKTSDLKRKTDSTKASVNNLTGKKDSTKNNQYAYNNAGVSNTPNYPGTRGRSKDQLDFHLTGCVGDAATQTVTIYFTLGNPVKVNQSVGIYVAQAKAVDMDGDQCRPKEATLANGDGSWKQLPTGVTMQGSITFANVLPKEAQLATVEFTIGTRNYDGGGDYQNKSIAFKNLGITWQ